MRANQRKHDQIRPLKIETNVIRYAEGSAMIHLGHTQVLCTASVENKVPRWLLGGGKGWVTAEYGMLPRSTHDRITRERAYDSGRSQEISRLISRSLRSAIKLEALGEKQILIDCDVIQADGGTRTAAITGGFVALTLALKLLHEQGELKNFPMQHYVAATSVGWKENQGVLDMDYEEDSSIHTDMNFVMTNQNQFIEIQGTAEKTPFDRMQMNAMMDLAQKGCSELFKAQAEHIGSFFPLKV